MENVVIVCAGLDVKDYEIQEFKELINACDMQIEECFMQALKGIHLRTYIGKGKCEEIAQYVQEHDINRVVFLHDLSPLQIRNLEEVLQISVMDRTELILAIFKSRATTPVARLQVESAHLKKLLPRLIGANMQLGRQSASGKNKGSGEKQLELDRRRIKARLHEVSRELKEVELQRKTQRRARQRSSLPLVSLVGYTNAGKSTIMNALLTRSEAIEDKFVLEKDMLFATLDTSIRRISIPQKESFLLSDTVGFVRQLPHELINAFHSTLEEVQYANLLLHIVDASDEEKDKHMQVTNDTLRDIGAGEIPVITIYNQCDKTDFHYPMMKQDIVYMSAKDTHSIDVLFDVIYEHLHKDIIASKLFIPYEHTDMYMKLRNQTHIIEMHEDEYGYHVYTNLQASQINTFQGFLEKE